MRKLPHPHRDQFELTTILDALSDPTRLGIVIMLARGDETRCKDFTELSASKPNLTYHFTRLREAGVIRVRIEGTFRYISLRREDLESRFPGLLPAVIVAASASSEVQSALAEAPGEGETASAPERASTPGSRETNRISTVGERRPGAEPGEAQPEEVTGAPADRSRGGSAPRAASHGRRGPRRHGAR